MSEKDSVYVTCPSLPSFKEYSQEIRKIWETKIMTNGGILHKELEERLKEHLHLDNIVLTSHGHCALEIAIQSMGLKGEVITTPFTFVSTAHAIVRSGLKPVFCDIKNSDYTIDEDKIEELINENTCAIVPVHVFGNVCNVDKISEIARKYSLKVIYDAAHTFGEVYNGKHVVNYGDASIISFHATKIFNTVEGGAICTADTELATTMLQLRNFGIQDAEHINYIGCNAKMSEFHAAMGICNLRYYEEGIHKRKKIVGKYVEELSEIKGITIPTYKDNTIYNYAYFPILVEKQNFGYSRDDVYVWLANKKIYSRKYFYPLINSLECYGGDNSKQTPNALNIANNILCLPLHEDMDIETVEYITEIIRRKI